MHVDEALRDIQLIRRQLARTEQFRGYRALPVAGGGVLAGVVAVIQPWLIPEPDVQLWLYVALWVGVCLIAGGWSVLAALARARQIPLHKSNTRMALEQFSPCVAAGALVTWVIALRAPEVGWVLPGLWAVLYSLGLFASFRLIPTSILGPATWYMAMGCIVLAAGPEGRLAPWTMGLTFGIGELAIAWVLLEQSRDEREGADG